MNGLQQREIYEKAEETFPDDGKRHFTMQNIAVKKYTRKYRELKKLNVSSPTQGLPPQKLLSRAVTQRPN